MSLVGDVAAVNSVRQAFSPLFAQENTGLGTNYLNLFTTSLQLKHLLLLAAAQGLTRNAFIGPSVTVSVVQYLSTTCFRKLVPANANYHAVLQLTGL